MITIKVRNTKIPALGYGTWRLAGRECVQGVARALGVGYRHIDTAQIYENESEVGEAIKQSNIDRGEIFLTTKVWMDRVSGGSLQKSVDESLKKLKTDYVDLLLIHWPVPNIPFAEQMKALMDVRKSGKTKNIGVSNFTVAQMREVVESIGAPVIANQVEYHPFLSQKPVLDYIRRHDMFLTAYSPLARGKINESPILRDIAEKHAKTPGQITLRWLLQQERVAAIPKAASEKHMLDNFNIFDFILTEPEMLLINTLAAPEGRLINPEWAPDWDKAA